jgi:hypothetical protein
MFQWRQWMLRTAFLAVLGSALSFGARAHAAAAASEPELKAVLLFHLTHFVEWPASGTNSQEFVIGILGPDPFGGAIDEVVKEKTAGGRPIRVKRLMRPAEARGCAIVFVSAQWREPLRRVFDAVKNSSVLVVGETAEFMDAGGMIRFRQTPDRKVRLQVQLTRVRERGLNVSAQLLRVADVVQGEDAK